ncbi:MAG: ABC transporter permease [Clostridiales bacterium]|nr:ABC transporter permease [Clostridiales bacterium]
MKTVLKTLNKYKYLLQQLVLKDIKLKYRRSYLGYVWTLLEPLLTMIVLAVVFDKLRGKDDPCFPVYILTARLLYTFFSNGTKSAMKSIRANASMIKKVYVPKYMYPLSGVLSNFIIFLLSLVVLIATEAFFQIKPTAYMLLSWLPLLILLIMTMGVGLILSTMAVFFRDLEYLWNIALMLIMYCSAIFYSPESVAKEGFSWVFDLNPLYAVIRNFRNLVLYGRGFHQPSMIYASCFAVGSLIIGLLVFYKKQDDFILNI